MTKRRDVIKLSLSGLAALALDPTGILRPSSASALDVDAEAWENFLIVQPGSARPSRKTAPPPGATISLATEPTLGGAPRVRTVEYGPDKPMPAGQLRAWEHDPSRLQQTAQRALVTSDGKTIVETRTFNDLSTGWTVNMHCDPQAGVPYVLMPLGNSQDGFYVWNRGEWHGRRIIGAAPGTTAMAMWISRHALFRVEIQTEAILGPDRFLPILREIEPAFRES